MATPSDWNETLDEIDEYLDGRADVDDGMPNEAMRLLNRLREARAYREARGFDTAAKGIIWDAGGGLYRRDRRQS